MNIEQIRAEYIDRSVPASKEKQMNTEIDDSIVLDAMRYRWLRHGDNDEKVLKTYTSRLSEPGEPTMFLPRNDELDRLIDAARAARAPADSVLEDAARLDWLLLHISGAEFRRIGVHYSGNASRADVDAARKQGANHE
jgi:hypothetical protein